MERMDLSEIAAETTTQKESSKLMDAIELMEEESSAGVTTSLKKRKAQSDLAEEETKESGDESEEEPAEERDESEEERTRVNGPYPQWDVDSFDGLDYHSSDEFNEFSDEEHDKLCREFKRVLFANKGFYVPPELIPWCHYSRINIISNLDIVSSFGQSYREYFAEMARLCLERYNKEKSKQNGFTVELVQVVSVYFKAGERSKSYITFTAKEKPDGPLVDYQAKAWTSYKRGDIHPILCRPAPYMAKL